MSLADCFGALNGLDASDADAIDASLRTCLDAALDPSLWVWTLGLTLACALVGLFVGIAKGRWLAGLLWGAMLGPIGWIVVALSKSGFVECPDCGRRNAPSAKACRHCGVNLRAAAQRSPRADNRRIDRGRGW
ncbi:MAG TPA: hypothetical protein VGC30_00770 [Dokdonella sp.]